MPLILDNARDVFLQTLLPRWRDERITTPSGEYDVDVDLRIRVGHVLFNSYGVGQCFWVIRVLQTFDLYEVDIPRIEVTNCDLKD